MFTTKNNRVVVSVINDLVTDIRVFKTCMELSTMGYDVILVGRVLKNSPEIPKWPFQTKRMKLLFTKGVLFYFFFNLRLFFYLLFTKADLLFSNDLDTLGPNYLVSKLKKTPLIYDSHELFCEVPELEATPFKKKIWQWLESSTVPHLQHLITVNQSIAEVFRKRYQVNFNVVRNIPISIETTVTKSKTELNIPADSKIIILQGAGINIDRGAEELVKAMNYLEQVVLLIIGSGDVWKKLEHLIELNNLTSKVKLISRVSKAELNAYTALADLGISIDKPTSLNYKLSLPNKIFDYINAQIPILATRLPEIELILLRYSIGDFINHHEPKHIAEKINEMLYSSEYKTWKDNLINAKKELTWDKEREVLISVIKHVSN